MNSALIVPVVSGAAALVVTLATGYMLLARRDRTGLRPRWHNALPLVAGLVAGLGLMGIFAGSYAPDRFFSVGRAVKTLVALIGGAVIIWSLDLVLPRPPARAGKRVAGHVVTMLAASLLLVWAGVKFDLIALPGEGVKELGPLAAGLTVAWLMIATGTIRLLDGLHGAASVALLVAGLAALYSNVVSAEYFLAGFSLVCVGCAIGSLRFCLSDNRMPLEGTGTAIVGFLFAAITVMARQKTVAGMLLLLPLVLITLVAGAAMLGLLERRLLLPGRKNVPEGRKGTPRS